MRAPRRGSLLSLESLSAALCILAVLWLQAPGAFRGEAFYSLDGPLSAHPWRGELFGRQAPPPAHNPTLHEEDFLYFPGLCHLVRTWHETGSLALWNPHVYCGAPMAGNVQFPAFYPFHLLLPLFCPRDRPFAPADLAFGLSCTGLLRWGLAAWFAFLWLRRLRASRLGAGAGALVLAFGPYLSSWIQFTPGQVFSLFPAVLFCAEGFLATGSALSLLGLSAWLAASNLGGYPQTSLFLVAFLVLYLAVRARGEGRRLATLWPAAIAIALACAAAAVSWLPFLDYLDHSELRNLRHAEPLWPEVAATSTSTFVLRAALAWGCLAALAVPAVRAVPYLPGLLLGLAGALGALAGGDPQLQYLVLPDAAGHPVRGGYSGPHNWIETNQDALGAGVAFLALAVLPLARGDHRARLATGVLLFAILYGMRFPLLHQAGRVLLPLAAPTRISVLVPLCAAMAVALALTELPSVLQASAAGILRAAFRSLLAALGAYVLALRLLGQEANASDVTALAFIGAGAVVVFLLQVTSHRAAVLLGVVAVLSAVWPAFRFHPTVPRDRVYPVTQAVATLLEERRRDPTVRVFAADRGCFPPNSPAVYGLSQSLGYDNFDPFDFIRLLDNLTLPPGLPRVEWNTASFALGSPLWRLLGSRLVATETDVRPAGWRVVHEGAGFRIIEDPGALPRAFLVGTAYWIHEDPSRLARTPARDAVALGRREALVRPTPALANGEAAIERLLPDEVVVRVRGDGHGWLVLLDQHLPGWHAFVDGRPAAIEQAFVCFRAVAVPPGECVVRFRYLPDSFVTGCWISLAAAIAMLVLAALTAALRAAGRATAARP